MIRKIISVFLCLFLFFQQSGFAQIAGELDLSAHLSAMRALTSQNKFRPLHLRYISFDEPTNSFKLLLDKGSDSRGRLNVPYSVDNLTAETKKLLNYFFAGLSIPNDAFWVNLRPDSPDNIIDKRLENTELGRILLEADVQLKKDTSLATSPQTPEGKLYWDKLYKKAGELFGEESITIPTLTRPWIVPDEIIMRQVGSSAYIYKATLKVMLEEDYLNSYQSPVTSHQYNFTDIRLKELNKYASELARELIIPKITKEVNTSKKYAALRQVYYSLIFAQWFKSTGRGTACRAPTDTSWSKETYFKQYQQSFRDGEYNIKEPVSTVFGQSIKSYFSGGINFGDGASSSIVSAIEKDVIQGNPNKQLTFNSNSLISAEFINGTISINLEDRTSMIDSYDNNKILKKLKIKTDIITLNNDINLINDIKKVRILELLKRKILYSKNSRIRRNAIISLTRELASLYYFSPRSIKNILLDLGGSFRKIIFESNDNELIVVVSFLYLFAAIRLSRGFEELLLPAAEENEAISEIISLLSLFTMERLIPGYLRFDFGYYVPMLSGLKEEGRYLLKNFNKIMDKKEGGVYKKLSPTQLLKYILDISGVKIVFDAYEGASINSIKSLIARFGLTRNNVVIGYSREVSEDDARMNFPGYELKSWFMEREFTATPLTRESVILHFYDGGEKLLNFYEFLFSYGVIKYDLDFFSGSKTAYGIRKQLGAGGKKIIILCSPSINEIKIFMDIYHSLYGRAEDHWTKDDLSGLPLVVIARRKIVDREDLELQKILRYDKVKERNITGKPFENTRNNNVLLLNTKHELLSMMSAANVCIVGHDHNILEPASQARPILYFSGYWINNYAPYEALKEGGGALEFSVDNLKKILEDFSEAKKISRKAVEVLKDFKNKKIPLAAEEAALTILPTAIIMAAEKMNIRGSFPEKFSAQNSAVKSTSSSISKEILWYSQSVDFKVPFQKMKHNHFLIHKNAQNLAEEVAKATGDLEKAEQLSFRLKHLDVKEYFIALKYLESILNIEENKNNSSPVIELKEKRGGVDFRALPVPAASKPALGMRLGMGFVGVVPIELNAQWSRIQNMVNSGITPSMERIKEYLVGCCLGNSLDKDTDKVISCLADILRLEEDQLMPTEQPLKDILNLLEKGLPAQELSLAINNISVLAKEPKNIP